MITKDQSDAISVLVAEARLRLGLELADRKVTIINTNFAHSTGNDDLIDGTQKKGFVTAVDEKVVGKALAAVVASVLSDVDKCDGCNGYLLNWFSVQSNAELLKVTLRGCPTIVPDGFDFERASAELSLSNQSDAKPYGFALLCHPGLVSKAPVEADA